VTDGVPENTALADETSMPSHLSSDTLNDVEAISELQEKCVEKRRARENDEKDGGILANLSCANKVSNTSICVDAVVDNQRTDENDVEAKNKEESYEKWETKKTS